MLGGFLNSGFGRAMELGAGIGLGEDLINSIFLAPVLFPGLAPVAQLDRATAF